MGQDFSNADKGKNFKQGGFMKNEMHEHHMHMAHHHQQEAMKHGGHVKKMASGGITSEKMDLVKTAAPSKDGIATKGKTKGMMPKMADSKPLGMKKGGKAKY